MSPSGSIISEVYFGGGRGANNRVGGKIEQPKICALEFQSPGTNTLPETNRSPLKVDPRKRKDTVFLLETTSFKGFVWFC